MQLKTVESKPSKVRLALQGPSGSGKTYTALLLAYGLCGAYEKIALIDTDYRTANLYSYFGPFNTVSLSAPFTPQKFNDALTLCERAGIEVIIIDTLSAEWCGSGGIVETLKEEGEEALLWHQSLLEAIKESSCHIIATLQVEEGYRLTIAGTKREVEKYGLRPLQKEDIHYHFHTVLSLDMKHRAKSLKDRASFFEEHNSVVLTEELASLYARWIGEGEKTSVDTTLQERINGCKSVGELLELMFGTEAKEASTLQALLKKRLELEALNENPITSLNKFNQNGSDHNRARA
jgi:hypothetical protein